jgi:hypothetical protein
LVVVVVVVVVVLLLLLLVVVVAEDACGAAYGSMLTWLAAVLVVH